MIGLASHRTRDMAMFERTPNCFLNARRTLLNELFDPQPNGSTAGKRAKNEKMPLLCPPHATFFISYRSGTHTTGILNATYITCNVYDGVHQPPGAAFQAPLLDNQEGANSELYVFESSRRVASNANLFGIGTIPTVEISSMECDTHRRIRVLLCNAELFTASDCRCSRSRS